jgi:hypothetical protein
MRFFLDGFKSCTWFDHVLELSHAGLIFDLLFSKLQMVSTNVDGARPDGTQRVTAG